MADSTLDERALQYAELCKLALNFQRPLGFGNDGKVWRSDQNTAVKALGREPVYRNELSCYQRLKATGVSEINGLSVPQFVNHYDDLMIVEMEIVSPPFLLDFGKVWLDRRPDYSDEVWADWESKGIELFGPRWEDVQSILRILRRYGIHYVDPTPGNINFGDPETT